MSPPWRFCRPRPSQFEDVPTSAESGSVGIGSSLLGRVLKAALLVGVWSVAPAFADNLSISPGSLNFSAQLGASPPATQSVQVSSGGGGVSYSVTVATSSGGNWLSYSPSNYSTPATVYVNVNPAVVTAAGTYNGTLTITATGLSGSPAVIPVTFTVTGNALSITPGSLSFSAQLGSSPPATQSLQVTSGGGGVSYSVAVATSSGGNWLSYSPSNYSTPATVYVNVNPVVPAAGTYNGTVTITAAGLSGSPAVIPVTFTVTGNTLVVSPAFATSALPNGVVNVPYVGATLTATGGTLPYTWAATGLPSGMTLGSSGVLSGTPAAAGTFTPMFTVTDSSSPRQTAQAAIDLTISALSITSLSPTTATAGGPAFTLTVNGMGFVTGSIVQWNGTPLTTTYVSATQLTATVAASLIASSGTATITVINPGGATSSGVSYPIGLSTITSLSPTTAATGGPGFTLTVNGSGFVSGSTVQWNGTGLTTTYISATQLTATVPASLIASAGAASISVVNPNSTISNVVTFTITALSITSLSPNTTTAGGAAFVLGVNGTGFLSGSTVQWNGTALTTAFVSSTQLTASVTGILIASAGTANVTVINPGGAASAPVPFTITATLTLSSLSPNSAAAGGSALTLTAVGSGFVSGSILQWNGNALATAFVSATQLTASMPASLTASMGTASVRVVNPDGTVSNELPFTIGTSLRISSSILPGGVVGTAYSQTLSATAGAPPYGNWILNAGSLPPGLTLNATSGLISGVPSSATGSPFSFNVIVKDSTGASSPPQSLSIAVSQPSGLTIITPSPLPPGTVGGAYTAAFAATSGANPYKSWEITAGSIPPGTSLSTLGSLTALLSGTPTAAGAYSFTVQVTDNAGTTATKRFDLTITPAGTISVSASGIVNSASYVGGGVAPGEIVVIFGSGMGPSQLVGLQLDSNGAVARTLAGVQVLFDNVPASLIYVQASQISAIVPYEVAGKSSTQVQVIYQGQSSAVLTVPVVSAQPGLFTSDSSGSGAGAILNQDGTINSSSNPAAVGSYVSVYCTGEGQTNPAGVDGTLDAWPPPQSVQKVTATVGGMGTPVAYAGGSPGSVAGFLQVNLQVPITLPSGSAFVVLNIGGATSQTGVTIAVQGSGR